MGSYKTTDHRKKLQETQENPYFTLNYQENRGFPGFFPGVVFYERWFLPFKDYINSMFTREYGNGLLSDSGKSKGLDGHHDSVQTQKPK